MKAKQYIVEFKIGNLWVQTRPFEGIGDDTTARVTEKTLHDAGLKARVVALTTSREIIGE